MTNQTDAMNTENMNTPLADILQTPEAYMLMLDMPGATKESINVSMDGDTLVVKAGVEPLHDEKTPLLFQELRTGGYYRAFNMGEDIDRKNVDARYEDGVLTLKLFKSEDAKPREIKIH